MNFTLDQLRAFLEVSRSGGVRKAADRLNITQPAVTARIKALEDILGTELFDRANNMKLTKRGSALQSYAEQYLALGSLIERDVAGPDGISGLFRLGVSETIVQSWLPDFVRSLRAAFPKVTVEIDVDISVNLRASLLEKQIDLAILMGPVSDYRVENLTLPDFDLHWFHGADASAFEPGPGAPVITFSRDTRPYQAMKHALLERYRSEVAMFPSSSLSACFRMVAAGLGVAALPVALAKPYLDRGELVTFDPGWRPEPLSFTASYLAESQGILASKAGLIAQRVASEYDKFN